jgi:ribosome biogenesis GTPase / thiamine phosphate phosphatase
VDIVLIVQGVPDDFNLRRLERYITIVRQGGATPVVVLNKIDLNLDFQEMIDAAKTVVGDSQVIGVSAKTGAGMEELQKLIQPDTTIAFLGSSGVGKSTLVNSILGVDTQATQEIRESDGKGRHTTTKREMIKLPGGGILIDTPGMRELGAWNMDLAQAATFSDIDELALQCKYSSCDHDKSEGCAIKAALDSGELDQARYQSYLKLHKEEEFRVAKTDKNKAHERNLNGRRSQRP